MKSVVATDSTWAGDSYCQIYGYIEVRNHQPLMRRLSRNSDIIGGNYDMTEKFLKVAFRMFRREKETEIIRIYTTGIFVTSALAQVTLVCNIQSVNAHPRKNFFFF